MDSHSKHSKNSSFEIPSRIFPFLKIVLIFKFIHKFLYKPALPHTHSHTQTRQVERTHDTLLITKMSRNSCVWLPGLGDEELKSASLPSRSAPWGGGGGGEASCHTVQER